MKRSFCRLLVCVCILANVSCDKTAEELINPPTEDGYKEYTIEAGQQYSGNLFPSEYKSTKLKFKVKFDSSAIYTTVLPENQDDINKLYGYSDCGKEHHTESARFGWRWSDSSLRIFAYCYVNKNLFFKEMGSVEIGKEHSCEIAVSGNKYIFTLNSIKDTMDRGCDADTSGSRYRLYPFFGGSENAPHNIRIKIKEEE